jgi:molecular chaperone DnaK
MVKDAKSHETEDKRRREEIDTRNRADQQVYETEKFIKENESKLPPDAKPKLEAAIGRLKEAIKGSNVDEIKSATEALTQVWHQVAGEMYKQTTSQQTAGGQPEDGRQAAGGEKKQDGGAVDADYEVVN